MAATRNPKAGPPVTPAGPGRSWDGRLGPRLWAPAGVLLAAAVIALGIVAVVRGGDGGEMTSAPAVACPPGRTDCGLRQRVHWHADFALYVRGQRFDFNKPQFISHEGAEKSQYAHIHEGKTPERTQVVHVHYEQTTWDEFLRSLGFELVDPTYEGTKAACLKLPGGEKLCSTATESFKFFVNGVRVDGVANMDIADLQRVLISYGSETAEQARQQFDTVSDQACILSEVCKDRIDPNEPPEECSKSSTTCN
jgi:hypothetical protein